MVRDASGGPKDFVENPYAVCRVWGVTVGVWIRCTHQLFPPVDEARLRRASKTMVNSVAAAR
jgi:hypothetical protein